jgi:hypothetical protein
MANRLECRSTLLVALDNFQRRQRRTGDVDRGFLWRLEQGLIENIISANDPAFQSVIQGPLSQYTSKQQRRQKKLERRHTFSQPPKPTSIQVDQSKQRRSLTTSQRQLPRQATVHFRNVPSEESEDEESKSHNIQPMPESEDDESESSEDDDDEAWIDEAGESDQEEGEDRVTGHGNVITANVRRISEHALIKLPTGKKSVMWSAFHTSWNIKTAKCCIPCIREAYYDLDVREAIDRSAWQLLSMHTPGLDPWTFDTQIDADTVTRKVKKLPCVYIRVA